MSATPTWPPQPPARRLAILTAPFGMGHQQAARALADAAPSSWVVRLIDPFQYLPAQAGSRLVRAYLDLLRFAPYLWGMVYSATEANTTAALRSAVARGLWLLIGRRLQRELTSFRPDAVVAVHPFCAGLADAWIASTLWAGVFVVVTTDYAPHPFWFYPSVSAYCVATPAFAQACRARGIPTERLHVTGIPLRTQFESPPSLPAARESLGLPARGSVVLLMGGGLGLGRLAELAEQLAHSPSLTTVVLTGKNRDLQQSLAALATSINGQPAPPPEHSRQPDTESPPSSPRLIVQGPVENVASWMAASNLLVSKPGGLTVAEALAVGVPLVLVDPLPGQEEANAKFLTRMRVAWLARHAEVAPLIQRLLAADPAEQEHWRGQSRALGRPQATHAILDILDTLTCSPTTPVTPTAYPPPGPDVPAAAGDSPTEPTLAPSESSWSPLPGPAP